MLGRGGYGAVYLGLDIHEGNFVAIKQITLSNIPRNQIGGIMVSPFSLPQPTQHRT